MSKPKTYEFNREIQSRLKGFKTCLQEQGNSENTIRQKSNYAGYFLTWLEAENLTPEETRYNDILNFIDHCHLEGKSKRHINRKLCSVRAYYEYLKRENAGITNPATGLFLKGTGKKLPSGIVSFKRLEQLYHEYPSGAGQAPANDTRTKRNKVILGLLVYQGVTTEELKQLEVSHVKLKSGKIYIPGGRRRSSRILELRPFQILELHEYLNKARPKILAEISVPKPARKPDKINREQLKGQLFISINGSENIKNSLLHMFRNIRKENPDILSPKQTCLTARQVRASVITHWLKEYNLRQVQYFAGHKYVSSTERYQMNHLDNLQKKLEKFHPLNRNQI